MIIYVVIAVIVLAIFVVLWRRNFKTVSKFSYLDDNVQFSVYRPGTIAPERWYPMLVFAHLSEGLSEGRSEGDPIQEVRKRAEQVLGEKIEHYRKVTQDSLHSVPREGEITFVPDVLGIEFNPLRRTFLWQESVHREEFRIRASKELDGQNARGHMSVFLGSILLAEINLNISVSSQEVSESTFKPIESSSAPKYRKIFASYSHSDTAIVEEFEKYARALGDEYLRDIVHLRTGEIWDSRTSSHCASAITFHIASKGRSTCTTVSRRDSTC